MGSLDKYRMHETGVLHLLDASGAPMYADNAEGKPDLSKPMRAHLFGPGSRQWAEANHIVNNENIDVLVGRKPAKTFDEAAASNARFLAACTSHFENIDEKPMDVYLDQRMSFVRDQVADYVKKPVNFTPGPPKP